MLPLLLKQTLCCCFFSQCCLRVDVQPEGAAWHSRIAHAFAHRTSADPSAQGFSAAFEARRHLDEIRQYFRDVYSSSAESGSFVVDLFVRACTSLAHTVSSACSSSR